jgi:hypothetical protein
MPMPAIAPVDVPRPPLMRGIKDWAEAHMDGVLANRENYDPQVR